MKTQDKESTFNLLNILDFNNDRKRMSVSKMSSKLIGLQWISIDNYQKRWEDYFILQRRGFENKRTIRSIGERNYVQNR